jgi:hypothetical protein
VARPPGSSRPRPCTGQAPARPDNGRHRVARGDDPPGRRRQVPHRAGRHPWWPALTQHGKYPADLPAALDGWQRRHLPAAVAAAQSGRCWATSSAAAWPEHTQSASVRCPAQRRVAACKRRGMRPAGPHTRCLATSSHHTTRAETAPVPDGRAVPHAAPPNLEDAVANTTGYTRLPTTTREDVLTAARKQAEQAAEQYAQLQAAEAGIASRAVFPNLARLVFRLSDDVFGPSAP